MEFSEKVKLLKAQKKMTTEDLSARTGIPVGTLSKILSGATETPKLGIAVKVAEALETSLEYLCGMSEHQPITEEEKALIDSYNMLDARGKKYINEMINREIERKKDMEDETEMRAANEYESEEKITLPLYILPASAGTGSFLDNSDYEDIQVRSTYTTRNADFAVKVSGNSMEPTFHHGDVLLVQKKAMVDKGELGIFVCDGEGYFKRYMGKYLHSLNPEYDDIPLSKFTQFICCGKVIGNLRRRTTA